MELLFALKILGTFVGMLIGAALASLIGAICLRLAARSMQFGNIPFMTAFKSTLMANFAMLVINFSICFSHGVAFSVLSNSSSSARGRPLDMTFAYPPIHFVYATLLILLVTSAIFRRTLRDNGHNERMTFGDAFALASFYYALAFSGVLLIGLLAYCIILGLLNVTGI